MIPKFFKKTVLVTTITVLSHGVIESNQAEAAVLFLGEYGDFASQWSSYLLSNYSNQLDYLSLATPNNTSSLLNSEKPNHTISKVVEGNKKPNNSRAINHPLISEGSSEQVLPENAEQNVASVQSQFIKPIGETKTSNNTFPLFITLFLLTSSPFFYSLFTVFKSSYKNLFEEFQDKFGNPKVPEGTVFLHDRAFKELLSLTRKAERVDSEKFSNREFLLFLELKKAGENGTLEEKQLYYSVELLRVAIATQNSFLRVEQTELRFRSTKQQEFYQFVLDTIAAEPNKDRFRDKVKKKLAEIIPLLNTEEGRDALQAYLKEVNIISEHELGLKLFALFKQYELADFSILKTISDLIARLQGYDLLSPKTLVLPIIENYEAFEKIAPVIEFKGENKTPENFVPILQYLGLNDRYLQAYEKFQQLIKILKQWQKPYQTIYLIREEYTADRYRLPPEFTKEIPGLNLYRKYEKYIE